MCTKCVPKNLTLLSTSVNFLSTSVPNVYCLNCTKATETKQEKQVIRNRRKKEAQKREEREAYDDSSDYEKLAGLTQNMNGK